MEPKVIEALEASFDENRVKTKKVPGRPDASYLESYDIINKANEVFGYGGWGTRIVDLQLRETGGKTACTVILELSVAESLPRQDVGVVIAAQKQGEALSPESLETAIKGAASDALKRSLRQFGKQFGNDLYDKDREPEKPGAKAKGETHADPAPKKPMAKGKLSTDAKTAFWAYAMEHGIKGSAETVLEKQGGNFEKALIILKENCGET